MSILVEQLANKNQFKLYLSHGTAFQSYTSIIAFKVRGGGVYLSDKWGYSKTTLKHLKLFLNTTATKKDIENLIETGVYVLVSEKELLDIINNAS